MSPKLAREHYFLRVLNEPASAHTERLAAAQPLAAEMHGLLGMLAQSVLSKTPCTSEQIAALNRVFEQDNTISLSVVVEDDDSDPRAGGAHGQMARTSLRARIRGQNGAEGQRVYLEAIISLLEALEEGDLDLAVCAECGAWFVPYSRAPVVKFCSGRCRNRFNYKARQSQAQVMP